MDPSTIPQTKINQFDKHVEILEEQRNRCARDVAKKSSSPNRSPRTVEMHHVQSVDTVDSQRQVPRTGTAQWQDPVGASCDATHVQ